MQNSMKCLLNFNKGSDLMNLGESIIYCRNQAKEIIMHSIKNKNIAEKYCDIADMLCELQERRESEEHPEILAVSQELNRAMSMHKPMNSAHEGYAIILEELDELWKEIKKKEYERNIDRMREEAMHVAAMGIRFMIDVCGKEKNANK